VLTLLLNDNFTMAVVLGASILGSVASLGDSALDAKGLPVIKAVSLWLSLIGIAHKLKVTKAKAVVCLPETSELATKAINLASSAAHLLCWGECENAANLQKLFDNPSSCPTPVDDVNPQTDMGLMFWSSGTTGTVL